MATTQERLRDLAGLYRKYKPRQTHWGMFVDELLLRAANDIDVANSLILQLATDPVLVAMTEALQSLERHNREKPVDAGVPTKEIINLRNAISAYCALKQER